MVRSCLLVLTAIETLASAGSAAADTVVYRVNAGGAAVAGSPGWAADTALSPAPEVNATETKNKDTSTNAAVSLTASDRPSTAA